MTNIGTEKLGVNSSEKTLKNRSILLFHFSNEGWSGLMDEMEMEVKRISKRNLGRDDRSVHGLYTLEAPLSVFFGRCSLADA